MDPFDGINTYYAVLKRLKQLSEWDSKDVVKNFHDPDMYLSMRSLNQSFTSSNYRMLEDGETGKSLPKDKLTRLPFLYFEGQMMQRFEGNSGMPEKIALINNTIKTANIIETNSVDVSLIQEKRSSILNETESILSNIENLSEKCKLICNRSKVISDYLSQYTITNKTHTQNKSNQKLAK